MEPQLFKHYSEFTGDWPWNNFTPKEVSCRHCGEFYHDAKAMAAIQLLRDGWGKPIVITSGHRCTVHNAIVDGAPKSQHLKIAFDCVCPRKDQDDFIKAALIAGFTGIGRYPARNFVHLDTRPEPKGWRG